ncbi:MAG: dTMP kinase, partial [Mycobacteriaceae bacterium]
GKLIALEGLDGAGKRTLTERLVAEWQKVGLSVFTLAFPRYGVSVHADIAAEALHGEHGDLANSAYAMAMIFALDRAEAKVQLHQALAHHEIVLLDRYVESNAAYGAARLYQSGSGDFSEWIRALEFERFAMPVPDHQLYLSVPVALAAERARNRESEDASRKRDVYERDNELQQRTGEVYTFLAQSDWVSSWTQVGPDVNSITLSIELLQVLGL